MARKLHLNFGSAIWAARLLLPYCKQAVGEDWGTLLSIVPHASFISGNSWNLWVHWMNFQVFSSEFIDFMDTP